MPIGTNTQRPLVVRRGSIGARLLAIVLQRRFCSLSGEIFNEIWAMMFAGFAGLAFLGYRRAAKVRSASAGGLRQLVACVAALLWLVVEVGGRADAAVMLQTPSGLDPGDPFRFVFVTDGIRDATSTNIADYDSFANSQAGGATYDGVVVNWLAIASTDSVDAIDHVGQATAPVYLSDGTLVTTSTTPAGLWSRELVHAINLDLAGNPVDPVFFVWTGTNPFGTGFGGPLGSLPTPQVGSATDTGDAWISSGRSNILDLRQLYGISSVLTVPPTAVPEPSTLTLLGAAFTVGLAINWTHRRRAQRRQRLVRPLATTA